MLRLNLLLNNVDYTAITTTGYTTVGGLGFNSNEVKSGDLFFAMKGTTSDGNDFIADAIAGGAAAVVTESELEGGIPYIRVKDVRKAYSIISGNYYNNPARFIKTIAVTGTNGKTTTAYLINEMLKGLGKKTAYIGTLYYEICGKRFQSDMTTPDSFTLQRMLAAMKEEGTEYLAMELSAHAIALKKTAGIVFDIGIFTNLTQDHLDFFKTMDAYKEVKKTFFTSGGCRLAVVNADDACGMEILSGATCPVVGYGLNSPADTFALNIKDTPLGTSYLINALGESVKIRTSLCGRFNVYNAMAALTAVKALGFSTEEAGDALQKVAPPDGRFNMLFHGGVRYIIDYAHTPDGLKNLLLAARQIAGKGRLLCLFGAGGNRDKGKRPLMGQIADELADMVILTKDNSRGEAPEDIINQIKGGIISMEKVEIVIDRGAAISRAAGLAVSGDVVVIAGKGAEIYMEEKGKKIPYSDFTALKNSLKPV